MCFYHKESKKREECMYEKRENRDTTTVLVEETTAHGERTQANCDDGRAS
jgi:hypothetical protein